MRYSITNLDSITARPFTDLQLLVSPYQGWEMDILQLQGNLTEWLVALEPRVSVPSPLASAPAGSTCPSKQGVLRGRYNTGFLLTRPKP